jgi:hypothetical protein
MEINHHFLKHVRYTVGVVDLPRPVPCVLIDLVWNSNMYIWGVSKARMITYPDAVWTLFSLLLGS